MSVPSLSSLALYDDIIRLQNILIDGSEQEFIRFALGQEEARLQWRSAVEECLRLQEALSISQKELSASESKLQHARRLLDQEKKQRKRAEIDKELLERQIALIRDLLVPQQSKLNDETKEKLAILNSTLKGGRSSHVAHDEDRLRTITEMDTTGSVLSDLSFSRSEDDLDSSYLRSGRKWKKGRASLDGDDAQSAKRRRSSHSSGRSRKKDAVSGDHLIATTTVHVSREGPVNAMCTIETGNKKESAELPKHQTYPSAPTLSEIISGPQEYDCSHPEPPFHNPKSSHLYPVLPGSSDSDEWPASQHNKPRQSGNGLAPDIGMAFEAMKKLNSRQHCFSEKTVIKSENCSACEKRINFGKIALKCRDCKVVSHLECKEQIPLPCIPSGNTPTFKKGVMGSIADYTPLSAPMVPSLVIHCVNEVESRGLGEVGIYRIPGSDKDVKSLKEKFLRGRGAPNLHGYDIHVVCGVLKDFLRNLREPLITHGLWHDFARAAEAPDPGDSVASLYQAISELPKPNRDTLAYLILHLQKVASCRDCKMPMSNLAKVFGPTITGYSGPDVSPSAMYQETKTQQQIIEALMKLPSEYWSPFINAESDDSLYTPRSANGLLSTPSTDNIKTPLTVKENREGLGRLSSRRRFFAASNTPNVTPRSNRWKGKKFFDTPT